jgi:hypothetical protein
VVILFGVFLLSYYLGADLKKKKDELEELIKVSKEELKNSFY